MRESEDILWAKEKCVTYSRGSLHKMRMPILVYISIAGRLSSYTCGMSAPKLSVSPEVVVKKRMIVEWCYKSGATTTTIPDFTRFTYAA